MKYLHQEHRVNRYHSLHLHLVHLHLPCTSCTCTSCIRKSTLRGFWKVGEGRCPRQGEGNTTDCGVFLCRWRRALIARHFSASLHLVAQDGGEAGEGRGGRAGGAGGLHPGRHALPQEALPLRGDQGQAALKEVAFNLFEGIYMSSKI